MVTRGDRGLQEVTGGYKGLQGVTGGEKGLQVCLVYKTSQIVFSRFIFTIYDMEIHCLQRVTGG